MAKVYTHMTMSLDGYIADPKDGTGELFGWYSAGDVCTPAGRRHHAELRRNPDGSFENIDL